MPIYTQSSEKKPHSKKNQQPLEYMYNLYGSNIISDENYEPWFEKTASIYASKKYKPVALKTKPVLATLPDKFRIIRNIKGDPLKDLPELSPHPPEFNSTTQYTPERKEYIDSIHNDDFLWKEERKLMHHFMCVQDQAFAWEDSERGSFRQDFFPPIDIPVVEHTPWVLRNIPIPPGIYSEVCKIIKTKLDARVYEPSNSSYRSHWFTVLKKDGKSLRIVHSLEPLNEVTIAHSGLPPTTDQLAENFAGRACGATLDLFVGYDERVLAESSGDLTTFQTPYGALRLVTLPMGWTNSVPIFHDDVTFILQPKIPQYTIPYIDDVPVRGPETHYEIGDTYETIPENSGIQRFVWEHFSNLNRIVQCMKYCGGTFSGKKVYLCCPEIIVIGHRCTYTGRLPLPSIVNPIIRWGPCKDISDARAFVGTAGVLRNFIENFAEKSLPLTRLFHKDAEFKFEKEEIQAQEDLKQAVQNSSALKPINYNSPGAVILAVDTGPAAVGYYLAQCNPDDPSIRNFARFGSITLNPRECGYSQAKREIYRLYRALGDCKLYLIGLPTFVVEVDASAIKGMLKNPDIAPSAAVNCWIIGILSFHFVLVHIPGTRHGPDGLSRRPPQEGDLPPPEDGMDDFLHTHYGLLQTSQLHSIFSITAEDTESSQESNNQLTYDDVPCTAQQILRDKRLEYILRWHTKLERPPGYNEEEYAKFMRYTMNFFEKNDKLWHKNLQGKHQLVIPQSKRIEIMIR